MPATTSACSTVTVSAAGTFGPEAIVTYEWRDAECNLRGTGAEARFDLAVGLHKLTLTVPDEAGEVSTDRVDVEVVGHGRIRLRATPPFPVGAVRGG